LCGRGDDVGAALREIFCLLLDANYTVVPLNRAENGSHPAGRICFQRINCQMGILNII